MPAYPIVCILASVLLQGLSYGYMTQGMNATATLLCVALAFLACTLVYGTGSRLMGMRLPAGSRMLLLKLNLASAVVFISFFVAITLIPASIASLLEAAAGPFWISLWLLRTGRLELSTLLVSLAIMVLGLIAMLMQVAMPGVAEISGIVLALLAAAGAALIAGYSAEAAARGLGASLILAHRFYLTWLAAFLMVWLSPHEAGITLLDGKLWLLMIGGVVAPMFLMQKGMQTCSPMITMLCLSVIPLFSYASEVFFGAAADWQVMSLLAAGVLLAVGKIVIEQQAGRRAAELQLQN